MIPIEDNAQLLEKYGLSQAEFDQLLNTSREKLFRVRDKRVHPGLDDKILTSLNALMITGYLDAYRVFKEERDELKFNWSMIGNIGEGRPNLGNTMDVSVYRLMQFTLRDVRILIKPTVRILPNAFAMQQRWGMS